VSSPPMPPRASNKLAYEVAKKTQQLQDLQNELNSLNALAEESISTDSPVTFSDKLKDIEQRLTDENFYAKVLEHMRVRQKLSFDKLKERVMLLTSENETTDERLKFAKSTLDEAEYTRQEVKNKVKYLREFMHEARAKRQESLEDMLAEVYESVNSAPAIRVSVTSRKGTLSVMHRKLLKRRAEHQKLLEKEHKWKDKAVQDANKMNNLLAVSKAQSPEEFLENYTKLMANNESLNKKLILMNTDLGPIKVEKRKIETEAKKLKLSMFIKKQLIAAIKSDRYDITDEAVLENYRKKLALMKLQKEKCKSSDYLLATLSQAIRGLLDKVGGTMVIDYDHEHTVGLLKLLELRLCDKMTDSGRAKPRKYSNLTKTPSSLTDIKTDSTKSKIKMKHERSKFLPLLSPTTASLELSIAQEQEQHVQFRNTMKKQLKGELPNLNVQPKGMKSTPNFMTGISSNRLRDSLPHFAKELSNVSHLTHKFIRENQNDQSASELYQDLWRRRSELKKLNSRTSSMMMIPCSPSLSSNFPIEKETPTSSPSKVKSTPVSPKPRKFTLKKVTKESEPMLDFISRMQNLMP